MKRRRSFNTDSDYSDWDWDEDDLSSHSSAQRELLRTELLGNVKYNDPSVFTRLHIYEEDDVVIDRCHERYQAEHEQNIKTLQMVTGDATKALRDVDVRAKKKKEDTEREYEIRMYDPLRSIFTFMTNFEGTTACVAREFQLAAHTSFSSPPARAADAYTPGIARLRPDFILVDKIEDHPFWDDCFGFAEIKVDADENKPPLDENLTVKPAILQCADYARYHMSFRPFWIFSVTLLITGTVFRVMIADHAGIILSPLHSIIDDAPASVRDSHHRRNAKTFVRVVRALTRLLTDTQLGQDPSVTPISRDELRSYLQTSSLPGIVRDKVSIDGSDYSRSYRINRFGNDSRVWYTVGPPIWASLSLLGRGTMVWQVLELSESKNGLAFEGDIHILKSSWRNPLKVSETDVYVLIGRLKAEDEMAEAKEAKETGECPRSHGVADLLFGSDVCYYENPQTWSTITIAHIRGQTEDPMDPSKVLHRIILPRVGEPLWKYTNELQLLYAFRSIIRAHQYLCDRGVLHRDISPGNTLLWLNEPALPAIWNAKPARGFLADFDMAAVDDSRLGHLVIREAVSPLKRTVDPLGQPVMTEGSVRSRIDYTSSRPRGIPVTGTLQFMALDLLNGLDEGKVIRHTSVHDLESVAYVLGYTVLRRLVNTPGCPNSLDKVFGRCFGGMTLQDIIAQRGSVQPLNWPYVSGRDEERVSFIREHLSTPLGEVLAELGTTLSTVHMTEMRKTFKQVFKRERRRPPIDDTFNHSFFLDLVDEAISELEQHPEMVKKFDPEQETLKPIPGSGKPPKKRVWSG